MTVSTFRAVRTVSIDGAAHAANDNDLFRCGQLFSGPSKTADRRAIHTFDLTAVPAEGPPVPANAAVTLAEFVGNVTLVIGAPDVFRLDRLAGDRSTYAYLITNWDNYDTAKPWRAPGAEDVEPPPSGLTYTSPGSTGDQVIVATLAAYVVDALTLRAGLLQLRHRLNAIAAPDDTYFTVKAYPPGDADITRLRVTWSGPAPANINRPQASVLPGPPPAAPARAAPAHSPAGAAPPARPPRTKRPSTARS